MQQKQIKYRYKNFNLFYSFFNGVAMQQFKVGQPVWIFLWASKNWSIFTKFVYVYEINNLRSYTESCDHILDAFYRVTVK